MRVYEIQKEGSRYSAIQIVDGRRIRTTISTPSLWEMRETLLRANYGFKIVSNKSKGDDVWVLLFEEEEP